MNKPQILKKIGVIIQELNEQHQYLTNTNKINLLELELFTANADFLIDHIEILKKINNTVLTAQWGDGKFECATWNSCHVTIGNEYFAS